jgi:hypothetical protein
VQFFNHEVQTDSLLRVTPAMNPLTCYHREAVANLLNGLPFRACFCDWSKPTLGFRIKFATSSSGEILEQPATILDSEGE